MPDLKERTAHYLRAHWFEAEENLARLLDEVHATRRTSESRTFKYRHGEIQGLAFDKRGATVFGHAAYSIRDEPASLVPRPCDEATIETPEQPAPAEHDYMQGDVFFLVTDNDVIVCASGTFISVMKAYVKTIIRQTIESDLSERLELIHVANADKVALIEEEGVRAVHLEASLFDASRRYARRRNSNKTALQRVLGATGGAFEALFAQEAAGLQHVGEGENLSVRVTLSFDRRLKGGEIGADRIMKTADLLVDEESSGYVIETTRGTRISPSETRLQKKIRVPPIGSSVQREATWRSLQDFYQELRDQGRLEQ